MRALALIALLAAPALADTAPPTREEAGRAGDVQRVYTAVVMHELSSGNGIVIGDVTKEIRFDDRKRMPAVANATIADFRRQPPQSVAKRFLLLRTILFAPPKTVEELFRTSGGWGEFHRRFPDTDGYLRFSPVGFNAARKEALVAIDYSCGELCGFGRWISLVKKHGVWQVKESIMAWIS